MSFKFKKTSALVKFINIFWKLIEFRTQTRPTLYGHMGAAEQAVNATLFDLIWLTDVYFLWNQVP